MTPVEELRSAAARLRQLAEAATSGPWTLEYPSPSTAGNTSIKALGGERVVASAGGLPPRHWPSRPDADYIAAVHPLVGLALAETLEHIADDLADERAEEAPHGEGGGRVVRATFPTKWVRWDWTAALKLARLLGGDS